MLILARLHETLASHPGDDGRGEQGHILLRVFAMLERANIRYCVLHGYEGFSRPIESDVDCIIDPSVSNRALRDLFHRNSDFIGAELIRCQGAYLVLACRNPDGTHSFLALDFTRHCDVKDLPLYDGDEILSTRRYEQFYIPASDVEFGAYLARCIAKKTLCEDRARRLSNLFRKNPAHCTAQIARHWSSKNAQFIVAGAQSGDWRSVRERLSSLQADLRWNAIKRRPLRFLANKFYSFTGRINRVLRPDGVSVVFLGPDGAGKSSVIETIGPKLADVFPRSTCLGFAPGLLAFLRRGKSSTSEPHGQQPRSQLVSLARIAYWFVFYMLGFVALRLAVARSTLVLYDRHFVDILVDQKRYRYGGPVWLLRLLWQIIPKPDLIILLDAPAEVLQARKQEVPFEVTALQRQAYLELVQTLPNGRIVDASQRPVHVANSIGEIILRYAANRVCGKTTNTI